MELLVILLIPLFAAGLSLVPTQKGKFAAVITIIASFAVFILSLHTALGAHPGMAGDDAKIAGWLSCNPFGALILLLISFVGLTASVFSLGYINASAKEMAMGRIRDRKSVV